MSAASGVAVRALLAVLAYLLALAAVAVCAFFAVIVLAGPHAGLLPRPLEVLVLMLGWAAVLVVPMLVARTAWRWLGRRAR